MQATKNDLSYNQTKLDYQALLDTAEIAFANTREELNKNLHSLYEHPLKGCFYLTTSRVETLAKQLNTVAETLYTLRGGLTREELEVVNKPEVITNG